MLHGMKRWGVLLTLVVLVAAIRVMARPPAPQPIHNTVKPVPASAAARGRLLYDQYGCAMCHGEDAKGGRSNQNAETEGKIPGLVKVAEGYTEAELVRLVSRGTVRIGRADAAGPVPPYRMPGWGDRLSDAELKDLVRYLISLAPKSPTKGWR